MKNFLNAAFIAAAIFAGAASASVTANAANTSLMLTYWVGR